MGWDDLVCAACSGRVADARCPTCRAALRSSGPDPLPAGPLLLLAALLLALLLVLVALQP